MPDTAVLQLVAYTALTLASVSIAGAAVAFAYRHNFGWKPLVLITDYSVAPHEDASGFDVRTVQFEFWNRQKYPVVVRSLWVSFEGVELIEDVRGYHYPEEWTVAKHKISRYRMAVPLEPNQHRVFTVRAPAKKHDPWERDRVTVEGRYFDPRKNRGILVTAGRGYIFN